MKKALAFCVLLGLASAASAASFQWTVSNIAFGGSTLKSDTGLAAYLVYLGNGGALAASYDASSILTDLQTVDSVSGTNTKGAAQKAYALPDPASGDYTELNGNVYGLLLSYVSGETTYYNLSSATYTVSGMDADGGASLDAFKPAASTFAYASSSDTGTVSPGGGWTAVPEPSTAALALAGLALLLKRRKA